MHASSANIFLSTPINGMSPGSGENMDGGDKCIYCT